MLNKLGTQEVETERVLLRRMKITDAEDNENNIGSGKALAKAGFYFTGKKYYTYEDNPIINGDYLYYVIESSCTGTPITDD
jgi:hypothetical protein